MSGSVNKVILVGNLGRDPETRHSQSGQKIVNMSLATSESWKDRNSGEQKEKTEWHRVVIFDERIADVAEKYLKKGSKVYLEGTLQTRKWEAQDGTEKFTTEVVVPKFNGVLTMLDNPGGGQRQETERKPEPEPRGGQSADGGDLSDAIPFVSWGDLPGKPVL